jgi:pyrophosphatase PpaX
MSATSSSDHPKQLAGSVDRLLFDLDGTLIDTTDLIFRSYQHALQEVLGVTASDEELYLGYGRPLPESFAAILEHQGVSLPPDQLSALIGDLVGTYRTFNVAHHDTLARPFPRVQTTLDELRRRGYRLGLVTSKGKVIAERGLRLIGLADAFDATVCQEDTTRHKPNPDPVWHALDLLDRRAQPETALFVGDSTHDLRAGRAAGVQTGAALWGPFPPDSLLALDPDHVFTTIADLLVLFP